MATDSSPPITDVQEAAIQRAALLPLIFEALPDAVVVVKKDGSIFLFNTAAEYMFGWTRAQVMGKHVNVLLPDYQGETHAELVKSYFMAPKVREMGAGKTLKAKHHNGSEFIVLIRLSPVTQGEEFFAIAVVRGVGG